MSSTHTWAVCHYCETHRQTGGVLPGYGRQVGDQSAEVFLLYSIMIGPGREGQDWSTTFVPSTWKPQTVKQGPIRANWTVLVSRTGPYWSPELDRTGLLPDTKATFSLSTVRTSTARTHSALPEPERRTQTEVLILETFLS